MMTPSALLHNALTLGQFTGSGNQSGQSNQSGSVSLQQGLDIMVGLGWLVAAVVLLIVAAVVLRKWLLRDDASSAGMQFTMADLRQMRDEGLMTPEEFDRAKKFLVSRGKAMLEETEEDDLAKAAAANRKAKAQEPDNQPDAHPDKKTDDSADDSQESSDKPQ